MTVARCLAAGLAFPESPVVSEDGSVVVSEMAAGAGSPVCAPTARPKR